MILLYVLIQIQIIQIQIIQILMSDFQFFACTPRESTSLIFLQVYIIFGATASRDKEMQIYNNFKRDKKSTRV